MPESFAKPESAADESGYRPVFTLALAATLFILGVGGILRSVSTASRTIDFSHYYIAANLVLSGSDPYTEPLKPYCESLGLEYDKRIPIGAHPPLLLRVFSWFCWLPLDQAYIVWAVVQATCLTVMLLVTWRVIGVSLGQPWALLFAGMVLCATSTQAHWHYSQVQLFVGALLYVGYAFHRQSRHQWACGLAAFAGFFKLYPLALLPYFVFARAGTVREMVRRLAVIAAVLVAVLSVTGIEAWHGFITRGIPVIQSSSSSYSNFSLQNVAGRMVDAVLEEIWPARSERVARLIAASVAGLGLLAAYAVVWRRSLAEHVPFCLLVTVMLVSAPVTWAHYMVLMILPAAVLLAYAARYPVRAVRFACPVVAVACLMPHVDMVVLPNGDSPWRLAIHAYPLVGLIAAALMLAVAPHRCRSARPHDSAISKMLPSPARAPSC